MTENNSSPMDAAANLAFFLLEKTGSVCGTWHGRMTAKEQRALYGRFIGKGVIIIDGARETICNRVKVCFGADWDDRNQATFAELVFPDREKIPAIEYCNI